ncbi:MAG: hypothetical protein GX329_05750 [Tissierellia bacterium]|nr:hypothetical protein [Tissierellia bacterium]
MKMDLLRTGNRLKLMEIRSNGYSIIFTGSISNEKSKAIKANMNIPASIIINDYRDEDITLKTITDFGKLVESSGNTMMPCFLKMASIK